MLRIASVLAVSFTFVGFARTPVLSLAQDRDQDDRDILEAVLAHTVRPAAEFFRQPDRLQVMTHSIPICPTSPPACLSRMSVERLRQPALPAMQGFRDNSGPQIGELMPQVAERDALVVSFLARNSERHALPVVQVSGIALVPLDEDQDANVPARSTLGYAAFSLPGYSNDGHALVYGKFACGGRCGRDWLFVLEKRDGTWHVLSRYMQGTG